MIKALYEELQILMVGDDNCGGSSGGGGCGGGKQKDVMCILNVEATNHWCDVCGIG